MLRDHKYFGELAIIRRQPRSANIVASHQSKVICINMTMLEAAQVQSLPRKESQHCGVR